MQGGGGACVKEGVRTVIKRPRCPHLSSRDGPLSYSVRAPVPLHAQLRHRQPAGVLQGGVQRGLGARARPGEGGAHLPVHHLM